MGVAGSFTLTVLLINDDMDCVKCAGALAIVTSALPSLLLPLNVRSEVICPMLILATGRGAHGPAGRPLFSKKWAGPSGHTICATQMDRLIGPTVSDFDDPAI